ncbi:hypothetical protein U9M49_10920 [Cytobacillus sp. OWB-43]|uniref:hypothetical protein n=1 Tax=Cytobacillus sp. OWB-43 TaxID=3108468 RepID=UPI002AFF669C|nr:hypothetical protein [Cytobacillus sp. OWB-43]MEA1853607.1 hypothetical protein [Cytobacillus sp. OWB-43]
MYYYYGPFGPQPYYQPQSYNNHNVRGLPGGFPGAGGFSGGDGPPSGGAPHLDDFMPGQGSPNNGGGMPNLGNFMPGQNNGGGIPNPADFLPGQNGNGGGMPNLQELLPGQNGSNSNGGGLPNLQDILPGQGESGSNGGMPSLEDLTELIPQPNESNGQNGQSEGNSGTNGNGQSDENAGEEGSTAPALPAPPSHYTVNKYHSLLKNPQTAKNILQSKGSACVNKWSIIQLTDGQILLMHITGHDANGQTQGVFWPSGRYGAFGSSDISGYSCRE